MANNVTMSKYGWLICGINWNLCHNVTTGRLRHICDQVYMDCTKPYLTLPKQDVFTIKCYNVYLTNIYQLNNLVFKMNAALHTNGSLVLLLKIFLPISSLVLKC